MDKLNITGRLRLEGFLRGKKIWESEDHNLITSNGYIALLTGISGASNPITKVQIGTNGTEPTSTDEAITTPVDITSLTFVVSASSLVITFTIGSLVGNGTTFREFGLILDDGSLFSRRVVTPIAKISDLTIECTWTIKI